MQPQLTINPNRISEDEAYMQMAEIWARRSKANRLQVGAILVKDKRIISDGYNGRPAGAKDDVCEYWHQGPQGYQDVEPEPILKTKDDVLHAESNVLLKIAHSGGVGADGATLYCTQSPCPECAKLIIQAQIKRVVYRNKYRLTQGIEICEKYGIKVEQLKGTK